jgi:2-polyprenyl-3-methyl-5-hydroxy-6-metoxy-1,4-benzoquinol methylase
MNAAHCFACAGALRFERTLFDDRYGYPGEYRLVVCEDCRHRRLDAAMDVQQISDLYTQYYPRSSFDIEAWSPPHEERPLRAWWRGLRASAFRWVPAKVRVLDIGCGLGESLGYHRARGCDAHGVEADRNVLGVAQRYGLNVKVGLFDASNYEPASFDVVTLDQVIEHVAEPASLLRGVHRVLKPGGLLVLSTPNADGWGARVFGNRWIHWHAPYHLQFFSRRSMALSAEQVGLVLEHCATVTNSAWLDYQWAHIATYPGAGQPSPFWTSAVRRSLGRRVALKLLRMVDSLGINGIVTRLMDALGRGDNVVYVLRKRDV